MVEAWAEFYQLLDNENEPEPAVPLPIRLITDHHHSPVQNNVVELCTICMDREVVVTLVPRSHQFCNIQMLQQNYNICPLCRL